MKEAAKKNLVAKITNFTKNTQQKNNNSEAKFQGLFNKGHPRFRQPELNSKCTPRKNARLSFVEKLWITSRNLHAGIEIYFRGLQEVIFGQTPCIVPEVEGWPGQKPTDRITRIEEFKR